MGEQKLASWYDSYYSEHGETVADPAMNGKLYEWAARAIAERPADGILDVGCGVGALLAALPEERYGWYVGIDFSEVAISLARTRYPGVQFSLRDALAPGLPVGEFGVVVMLEFLEHVDPDLTFIERLPEDMFVVASVPTFDAPQHVRHFKGDEVRERYAGLLDDFQLELVECWFCFTGRRNEWVKS